MLHTQRLTLRPFRQNDAPSYSSLFDENRKYLSGSFPLTANSILSEKDLKLFIEKKEKAWDDKKEFACGIFSKNDKTVIGYISVKNIDWDVPKGEMAYYIFQKHAGKGYATEALTVFRDWCFHEKKLVRLYARIISDNEPSIRVIEKCGFEHEGTMKKDFRTGEGELMDIKMFGCVR